MDWGDFWWGNVHGPRSAVRSISQHIIDGKSVICRFNADPPWLDRMRDSIRNRIERDAVNINDIFEIDASADLRESEDPGRYLIGRFTNGEMYRPHREKPWDYIRGTGDLDNKLLWVYQIPREQIPSWNDICRGLKGSSQMILEIKSFEGAFAAESVHIIKYLTENDFFLLAGQVASERVDIADSWRRYLSDIAAAAFYGKAEKIVDFIENFSPTDSPDAFDEAFSPDIIWRVQLRNVFHIIEEVRRSFIKRYETAIGECLPAMQFHEEITDPFDAEFGLIWHFTDPHREEKGKRRLYIPNHDYRNLFFLREVRNKLAHGNALTPNELQLLFDLCVS